MINGKRVTVVLPAYRAERTLERTVRDVPVGVVDEFILVDDCSPDGTVALARSLGLTCFVHERNRGYGGNQKTCYRKALDRGADVVVMLHPDYQYEPKLVPVLAYMIASGVYDVVLGSRILGRGALEGGMPLYKLVANRVLTFIENRALRLKISEYHTGYRAFSRAALESVDWERNSDDFVFDNQILVQFHDRGLRIGEVSCPTRYFDEASSIGPGRAMRYGIGVLVTSAQYVLHRLGLYHASIFDGPAGPEDPPAGSEADRT